MLLCTAATSSFTPLENTPACLQYRYSTVDKHFSMQYNWKYLRHGLKEVWGSMGGCALVIHPERVPLLVCSIDPIPYISRCTLQECTTYYTALYRYRRVVQSGISRLRIKGFTLVCFALAQDASDKSDSVHNSLNSLSHNKPYPTASCQSFPPMGEGVKIIVIQSNGRGEYTCNIIECLFTPSG